VLIDDDPLVRFNWTRQAQRKGILVHTFESFNSFIEVRRKFSLDVPIYIDSNLGKVKGELVSEELVSLGFVSVILTTGLPPHAISNTKWISGIVGKGFESAVLMNH
jgi:FixJ family two-component response regulator